MGNYCPTIFICIDPHVWGKSTNYKKCRLCRKYGIKEPEQFIDILGLWGDAVDNILGCRCGKTAQKLIEQFGSIENMLKTQGDKSEKLRQRVEENAEQAKLSKCLQTIVLMFQWILKRMS